MALHSLYCADVPLRNCSLTHSLDLVIDYGHDAAHWSLDFIRRASFQFLFKL